ncbi:Thioredoxin H-type [Glycine soja]
MIGAMGIPKKGDNIRNAIKPGQNRIHMVQFIQVLQFRGSETIRWGIVCARSKNDVNRGNNWIKAHADDDSDHIVELASGNVQLITTKESWDQKLDQARKESKIVIANFSATWCGPCKVIAPHYCELSVKYPSIMFLLVDVDELADFSTSWDIKATPTFFFLKDGKEVDKLVGANKPELEKKIVVVNDVVPHKQ